MLTKCLAPLVCLALLPSTAAAQEFEFFGSSNIFTPVKLDKGRNVRVYEVADRLVVSGFTWAPSAVQLTQEAYLVHQPLGRGHVVAFAEDPNFRAFCDGLNLLFLNAVFFGPGH